MLNAENPKKNRTASSFAISIWNEDPDTWEHYFDTLPTAIIKKVNISKVNLWAGEEGVINISCLIIDENNGAIRYKVLVNEEEVIPLSQSYSTPAEIEIPIPKTVFTEEENLFTLVVVDENDKEVSFSYIITVEDRDTFTFKRVFDFKEDYITDENIEVIYGRGLTLKETGRGEVNIEIPTEGKSKISNIVIEGGEDKEEELIIEREMTYLNDLGEGKVYESRLLTEYSDITDIVIDSIDGELYKEGVFGVGNEFIRNTSGATGTDYIQFNENHIRLHSKGTIFAGIVTKYPINFKYVDKIIVDWQGQRSSTNDFGDYGIIVDTAQMGTNTNGIKSIAKGSPTFSRIVEEIDVSDLTDYYYIKFYATSDVSSDGRYRYLFIYNVFLLDSNGKLIEPRFNLIKFNNKYCTYQNDEFVEVEPTVENFKEKNIYLSDLTTPTDKVILTMKGGEELEDGRLYRKTIDIRKYGDIRSIKESR